MLLHDQGNLAAAESEFRQALAIYDKSLPANHQYRASALMHFARLLVDRGKPDEALGLERAIAQDLDCDFAGLESARQRRPTPFTPMRWRIWARRAKRPMSSTTALPVLLKARGADDPVVRRAQNWLKAVRPQPLQTASTAH